MIHAAERKPNRLIQATSPYLLQHAHNPVDWFEWGDEALTKAKSEDKPILVSIGYSSCHWCHVMERESFEKQDVADLMNATFVCIKVDREERPDVDQVYMEAVQALGGHGGWPLHVFLTPDQKPFYGGTYFPKGHWMRLLSQLHQAFRDNRKEIESNAAELRDHLALNDLQRFGQGDINDVNIGDLDTMARILEDRFDKTWGGMDRAPKFVMPTLWLWLLRYHAITKKTETLTMVSLTLIRMQNGGLYDQLGGGFARYSVDERWFAPHFEKMLYDNAQLLSLYAEAYSVTGNPIFKKIVYETVGWLKREMRHPLGGFYSALDADSEGTEGKFYTWTYEELTDVLGSETEAFATYYHCTREGNWEDGRNILLQDERAPVGDALQQAKEKLLHARASRPRPGLDDKILTGWNALMIKGLTDAAGFFDEPEFLDLALAGIRFIETHLLDKTKVYRSFRDRRSETEGFLEDYAFLIQAYIALYQHTFNEEHIQKATHWCSYVVSHFADEKDGFFYFSSSGSEKLIVRKKEIFDNVIPGSNSVMARNLYHLGTLLDRGEWKQKAVIMVSNLATLIRSEPGYTSNWGILLSEITHGLAEIVVVGPGAVELQQALARHFTPFALVMGTPSTSTLPLFEGRIPTDEKTKVYVCFNKTCGLPVETADEVLAQLRQQQ
jgi:uncharacterized protein YyaL (SSP411 family)